MNIKKCKYINMVDADRNKIPNSPSCIKTTIQINASTDDILDVPLVKENRYYAEILRQVDAGELTIEPAG